MPFLQKALELEIGQNLMLKLALELITLDTYLKEIRTFVKVESMKCFILTLGSTIVVVTRMTSFVEYQFRKWRISMILVQFILRST